VRIHRVYHNHPLEPGQQAVVTGNRAHYLHRVLRVAAGQPIVVFNGDGHDYAAEVVRPGKNELVLLVKSRLPATAESKLNLTVVQALSRGERMDQSLQKCTELGVTKFQPLISERVKVRLKADRLARRLEHWRGVVISACEQSGRAMIPGVLEPVSLFDWLEEASDGLRLVLAPGTNQSLAGASLAGPLELAVGPEGGFSDSEMAFMSSRLVQPVSLGPRVLRTETAAPAATAVLQALAGDLQ
jgi:16S rRNA (uracil1498-N3)-methyltransferase